MNFKLSNGQLIFYVYHKYIFGSILTPDFKSDQFQMVQFVGANRLSLVNKQIVSSTTLLKQRISCRDDWINFNFLTKAFTTLSEINNFKWSWSFFKWWHFCLALVKFLKRCVNGKPKLIFYGQAQMNWQKFTYRENLLTGRVG